MNGCKLFYHAFRAADAAKIRQVKQRVSLMGERQPAATNDDSIERCFDDFFKIAQGVADQGQGVVFQFSGTVLSDPGQNA